MLYGYGAFSRKRGFFPENESYEAWLDDLIDVL